ncbi:Uncharacterised protein [Sphingomonas paucimobilis]|nr:Uncharacterised protein [Sphingomonas paucimobilis]
MTAPALAVRVADLAREDERQRIDAFVAEAGAGTPFHLTAGCSPGREDAGKRRIISSPIAPI